MTRRYSRTYSKLFIKASQIGFFSIFSSSRPLSSLRWHTHLHLHWKDLFKINLILFWINNIFKRVFVLWLSELPSKFLVLMLNLVRTMRFREEGEGYSSCAFWEFRLFKFVVPSYCSRKNNFRWFLLFFDWFINGSRYVFLGHFHFFVSIITRYRLWEIGF